jgi:drug/metabolite transporter (DMT)-like permease
MNQLSSHQRGLLMTVVGVLILSPDAVLLRLVAVDHWTVLFWRSVFAAVALFALSGFIEKANPITALRGLVKNGWPCAVLFAASNACFVISITHTAAANTLVILASMPFLAAVLTIALTRRNLAIRTWMTIFLAMTGIVIVFWGRFGGGGAFGDGAAVFCALFMAITLVMISMNPKINTLAAISYGSLLAAVFALLMGADPAAPSAPDIAYLVVNGAIVMALAMALITYGPKLISAPEVSLIMLLETVLGPLWVWWILSEQPPLQTFVGGGLVITAVLANAWMGFRSARSRVRS